MSTGGKYDRRYNGVCIGLFGDVALAKIMNLKLHAEVSGTSSVGALVGYVGDRTIISNCQVTASVTGGENSYGTFVSGFVGRVSGGGVEISDCTFKGSSSGYEAGGFIGALDSSGVVTVRDCVAEVAVAGGESAGGFIVKLLPTGSAVVERCSVSGTVSTPGQYAGGFCGWGGPRVTFTDCTASVRVTAKCKAGGFIGSLDGGAVTNCTAWGNVTATASAGRYEQEAVGGFVGYLTGAADFYGCSAWGDVVARRAHRSSSRQRRSISTA